MKQNNSIAGFAGLCAAALLGFLLRLWQLTNGRSDTGLWQTGSLPVLLLQLYCILVLLAIIVLIRHRPKQPDFSPCTGFGSSVGTLGGGLLLAAAGLLALPAAQGLTLITAVLGLAAGVVTVLQGIWQSKGRTPNLLLGCVLVIWLVLRIIGDFKNWSTNPAVLDYCYPLFALLCTMAGCFHVAGCLHGLGKGRLTLFWCAAATFFCAIALADGAGQTLLVYLALLLVNLQNTWCLLKAQ